MKVKIDSLDALFSEFIRKRAVSLSGGCQRCLTPKGWEELQCSHFHGRAVRAVRWDEDNAVGLCFGCHIYLDSHPLDKIKFFESLIGTVRFNLLNSRVRNFERPDREAITLYLRDKIRGIDQPNR